jgi:hypothetical protein
MLERALDAAGFDELDWVEGEPHTGKTVIWTESPAVRCSMPSCDRLPTELQLVTTLQLPDN